MPTILHPLQNIAVHVMKAEGIGREIPHRNRLLPVNPLASAAICVVAIVVRLIGAYRRPEVERRRRSRPRRVFPFRFRQQAVLFPRLGAETADEVLNVIPIDLLHRVAVTLEIARVKARFVAVSRPSQFKLPR